MKPDVVVPYRRSYSDEITYMSRSLANIPHRNVYVIGDKPKLRFWHIPFKQTSDVAKNTFNILNEAANTEDISDNFIWMSDDMFIMKPLETLPIHHRGFIRDILAGYKGRRKTNYYTQRMQRTYNKLLQLGVKDPLCYELHIPFLINKQKWNEVAKYIKGDYNKLTMYGNLHNIGGTKIDDVKVRTRDWVPKGAFISTHDSTFGVNAAGRLVREKFNEKGQYDYR
jgi:hypothetical protein